jgi:hypothetical protein
MARDYRSNLSILGNGGRPPHTNRLCSTAGPIKRSNRLSLLPIPAVQETSRLQRRDFLDLINRINDVSQPENHTGLPQKT